jgi:hypothetical protein
MNLDIAATGPAPAEQTTAGTSAPADPRDLASAEDISPAAVTLDTIPSSPPPEVLDAIGMAAQAPDRLAAAGQALHFRIDARTGKVTIEVHDLDGNLQATLQPSEVLDIADGGSVGS